MRDATRPEPWVEAARYYETLKPEYTVHFHIHMGYDVTIQADSEAEAIERAEEIFENVPVEDFDFLDFVNEGVV